MRGRTGFLLPLSLVHLCAILGTVTGADFIRRLRKVARARQVELRFEARPGKGSHGRLYYGEGFTTLKDRKKEIGPGLLQKMLTDLGLRRSDIEE